MLKKLLLLPLVALAAFWAVDANATFYGYKGDYVLEKRICSIDLKTERSTRLI